MSVWPEEQTLENFVAGEINPKIESVSAEMLNVSKKICGVIPRGILVKIFSRTNTKGDTYGTSQAPIEVLNISSPGVLLSMYADCEYVCTSRITAYITKNGVTKTFRLETSHGSSPNNRISASIATDLELLSSDISVADGFSGVYSGTSGASARTNELIEFDEMRVTLYQSSGSSGASQNSMFNTTASISYILL